MDNQLETSYLLIKHGADVDFRDNDQETALMKACDELRESFAFIIQFSSL